MLLINRIRRLPDSKIIPTSVELTTPCTSRLNYIFFCFLLFLPTYEQAYLDWCGFRTIAAMHTFVSKVWDQVTYGRRSNGLLIVERSNTLWHNARAPVYVIFLCGSMYVLFWRKTRIDRESQIKKKDMERKRRKEGDQAYKAYLLRKIFLLPIVPHEAEISQDYRCIIISLYRWPSHNSFLQLYIYNYYIYIIYIIL